MVNIFNHIITLILKNNIFTIKIAVKVDKHSTKIFWLQTLNNLPLNSILINCAPYNQLINKSCTHSHLEYQGSTLTRLCTVDFD